jgi:hypothetical protein
MDHDQGSAGHTLPDIREPRLIGKKAFNRRNAEISEIAMLHTIITWLVVAGFAGAGLFNSIGLSAQRESFVRWGYPSWWCRVTGLLELATAALVASPTTQAAGLVLGAVIMAAAALTVVRHREFSHLVPIGVFAGGLVAAGVTS